jgi:hypothetical protein
VAQFCRAGYCTAIAQEALWSVLHIPADLLPLVESAATAFSVLAATSAEQQLLFRHGGKNLTWEKGKCTEKIPVL